MRFLLLTRVAEALRNCARYRIGQGGGRIRRRLLSAWLVSVALTCGILVSAQAAVASGDAANGGKITIAKLSNRTSAVGDAAVLTIKATDSVKGARLQYTVGNAPPGLDNVIGATYHGWLRQAGTFDVTVVVSDGDPQTEVSAGFVWTVRSAGTAGPTGPLRLDLGNRCLGAGAGVQLWQCNGSKGQRWTFVQDGSIRATGKCLTETGTQNNAPVTLKPCVGTPAQRWGLSHVPGKGVYSPGPVLVNEESGNCLNDPASSVRDGTKPNMWTCKGGKNQLWAGPAGPVQSQVPGMCLAIQSKANAIVLAKCADSAGQRWTLPPDGTIRIAGKCLFVERTTHLPYALQLRQCGGEAAESWLYWSGDGLNGNAIGNQMGFPGVYLETTGGTAQGTPVRAGEYSGAVTQFWRPL